MGLQEIDLVAKTTHLASVDYELYFIRLETGKKQRVFLVFPAVFIECFSEYFDLDMYF